MAGEVDKGTESWNVAQGYTTLKILKPLVELDKLVKIARYGTENIEEAQTVPPDLKTIIRIEALNRIIDTLRELFENTEFAMTKKATREKLDGLRERTKKVEKLTDALTSKTSDQRNGREAEEINETHFTNCLNELRDIKKEIATPLNNNGLIFAHSEEVDLDMLKNKIIEEG